jgi:hypothetical protein
MLLLYWLARLGAILSYLAPEGKARFSFLCGEDTIYSENYIATKL